MVLVFLNEIWGTSEEEAFFRFVDEMITKTIS